MEICIDCGKRTVVEGTKRCSWCSKKLYDKQNKYTLNKKLKAIEYMGNKCNRCGESFNEPDVYDFHHLDPEEKDAGLSHLIKQKSWEKIRLELDKCEMLCANCHRKTHYYIRQEKKKIADSNINIKDYVLWTKEETVLLLKFYPEASRKYLLDLFINKSWVQIKEKARRLGVRRVDCARWINPWTEKDIATLIRIYSYEDKEIICQKIPNRGWNNIMNKAHHLGLKRRKLKNSKDRIDDLEIKVIQLHKEGLIYKEIQEKLCISANLFYKIVKNIPYKEREKYELLLKEEAKKLIDSYA